MNRREKILAVVVGSLVGLAVLYLAVNSLVLEEVRRLETQAQNLRKEIDRKKTQQQVYQARAAKLAPLLEKTFGSDEYRVSDQVRTRLTHLLKSSGLGITLNPLVGKTEKGRYKEIGWKVDASGRIGQLINFLYLLNAEPYLNRVENLYLTPKYRDGTVEMKLRFSTLALASSGGREIPPGEFPAAPGPEALRTETRKRYDVIATRDVFRPYLQYKPPPPPPAKPKPKEPAKPAPPPAKPPVKAKVVSLTTWGGQQEIHVLDISSGKVKTYRPGDDLADSRIVMIDYRPMPMPDKPRFLSPSRVILKQGNTYWAVELGQELSAKRRLSPAQLPDELKSK